MCIVLCFETKISSEKIYTEKTVIIPNVENRGRQDVLILFPVTNLITLLCSLNNFPLSVELPQNDIPYSNNN